MNKDLKRLIGIVGTFLLAIGFMGFVLFGVKGILMWILIFGMLTILGLIAMLFAYLDHDEDYL